MRLFIAFEGVDGCGKSYQSRWLYRKLVLSKIPAILTHEPGGTVLGVKIRLLLKKKLSTEIEPMAELLLISADRAQHVSEVIAPALEKGMVVVCDRFTGSTVAYQGYGRGLDMREIEQVNEIATRGIEPELNILLDLPFEDGLCRKKGSDNDRFEAENASFHQAVRDGYLKIAGENKAKWMVIDAKLKRREISNLIWEKVTSLIQSRM